ncbi:hypothetical protein [Teichococcus aestuarii]|uniref:Uncharacterized protein n=1 Tax=Teichococcus aestuarii TaxID=568898 RepID=A0A2U1V8X4_9PROT|nr:hypothetical protein [Pseudoroseomonas aestuarii]PWC30353.1 hypothetical protein CR165_00065 [Pseudoroseomonas aestuarii]
MLKTLAATALITLSLVPAAFAACSPDDAMLKASAIAEALAPKAQSKAEAAAAIMTEMNAAVGDGNVTAATCTKLDALLDRAKKL